MYALTTENQILQPVYLSTYTYVYSLIQVFISDGKILQFRSESVESQAHWMAALKVGLGKGDHYALCES